MVRPFLISPSYLYFCAFIPSRIVMSSIIIELTF